jgi:DNA polymerase III sliding clamp (beta) subunit (PCNA family)
MIFKANTIQDIQGNKLVITDENGISKLWYGQFYEYNREINQVSYIDIFEIDADTFNHAIDKIRLERQLKESKENNKSLRLKLKQYEDKVLKSRLLTLIGKKRQSKLNSFLR